MYTIDNIIVENHISKTDRLLAFQEKYQDESALQEKGALVYYKTQSRRHWSFFCKMKNLDYIAIKVDKTWESFIMLS